MIIQGKDYKIEKLENSEFYNLSLLSIINKGTDKEREEFKVISYGIPFDECIKKIVDYKLRQVDGTYTIKEYVDKYKDLVNEIGNEFET
jgi:hypothetical protein